MSIQKRNVVKTGLIEFEEDETKEFEAEFWEAFAYWVGKKIINLCKDEICSKECDLAFFL